MKKQELIHLHGLLAEVVKYCQMAGDIEPDLTDYEELGVRPTSIHRSKTMQTEAVFKLGEGITSDIDTSRELEGAEVLHERPELRSEKEAFDVLKSNAQLKAATGEQSTMELTEDVFEEMGSDAEYWLDRLEGSRIETGDEEYGIGTEVYLKI